LRLFAERAIRQWRYAPAILNSRPIEAATYATLDFRL
jgi:hypothetical protein